MVVRISKFQLSITVGGDDMITVTCDTSSDRCLRCAGQVFDIHFENSWFDDPLVEQMILDIDETTHISGAVFDSPYLGIIPPQFLSHGVKSLIYILKAKKPLEFIFMSGMFGDNCIPWLCKLSEIVDFDLCMAHPLALVSRAEKGNMPINAQTVDGQPLKTCGEVFKYYVQNHE